MKKTKKLLALLTACTLVLGTSFVNMPVVKAETTATTTFPENESPKAFPSTASQQYAQAMYPGWNLGNTYDANISTPGTKFDETAWGNPRVTKELIDKIKAEGFKSIRMPLTLGTRMAGAPDYTIDSDFLARYAQSVQWAIDDGLYVMVNIHHDSYGWVNYYEADDDNGAAKQEFEVVWKQLANYFKDYDSKVCLESINEPCIQNHNSKVSDDVAMQRLADLNTQFVNIVRATGGKNATRMLVLPTLNTSNAVPNCTSLYNTIQPLNDPNIMATIHYYGHWFFTENIQGYSTLEDGETIKEIHTAFDNAYNNFVSKGIGVIIGEYGVLDEGYRWDEPGEIAKFFEYVNYYSKVDGLTLMLWDNGSHLDRKTLTWKDPDLMNMMKASWNSRCSYTKSDRVFIKDKNNDVSIPVTLNGNTLASIYNGTTQLVEGQDYTYANSTVTLKSAYVSNLMTAGYGTKATLTFKFSAGADWKTDLISYAAPVLSSATGNSAGLTIPVQYNGSVISELEAVDANGAGVGPMSWSTYKDRYSFKDDYSANALTLTDNFFKELKVNQFVIKLHLQSGEVISLSMSKNGDNVTYTAQ